MAHLVETMAYAGEVPWHGLGAKVEKKASIEEWRKASGLTWEAKESPVAIKPDLSKDWQKVDGPKAIYRGDTGKLFYIATNRYKIVQPGEVLNFFKDLASVHDLQIETCGSLREGATVWALATNDSQIKVGGKDVVKPYLLLSTTYDGKGATDARWTTVRVVCNNTLQMSFDEGVENAVRVRHSTTFDPDVVKDRLGLLTEGMAAFQEMAEKLAAKAIKPKVVDRLLVDWFGQIRTDRREEAAELLGQGKVIPERWFTPQSVTTIETVRKSIMSAPGQNLPTAKGTAWGVLNGITHFVDFLAKARTNDNRLQHAWFGRGADLKAKAANELLKLAA